METTTDPKEPPIQTKSIGTPKAAHSKTAGNEADTIREEIDARLVAPVLTDDVREEIDFRRDVGLKIPDDPTSRYANLLARANIPPRFDGFTFHDVRDALDTEAKGGVFRAAKRYVEAEGQIEQRGTVRFCLFFAGPFGTGKTALATAVLKELCWRRVFQRREDAAPVWLKFYDFIRDVQSGYSDGSSASRLRRVQRAPLLLLDDVGDVERSRQETDDRRAILYEVVDYRNDFYLPTLLTTNLSRSGLEQAFGSRTMERVYEMAAMFNLTGANLRRVKVNGDRKGP